MGELTIICPCGKEEGLGTGDRHGARARSGGRTIKSRIRRKKDKERKKSILSTLFSYAIDVNLTLCVC